jgi:hypothetical protein
VPGLVGDSHGVRMSLHTDQPELIGAILGLLPPDTDLCALDGDDPHPAQLLIDVSHADPAAGGSPETELALNGVLVDRAPTGDDLLDQLERAVRLAVATLAERVTFVHAGVVAHAGRAVVLPGASRAGKTELVRALLAAGATYLSDEYALLHPSGAVAPYARPLSIRRADGAGRDRVAAADLGAIVATGPVPVGLVLVTGYHPGALWRPRRLTAGETTLALVANAVPARRRPEATLRCLGAVSRSVAAFETPRDDAAAAAERVLDLLSSSHPQGGPAHAT